MSEGNTETNAPVPQVSVPAILSAEVAISTLPAAVAEALGVTVHTSNSSHCAVERL